MYTNKKFLLIAGGGTLGTHTAAELLRLGAFVDVVCPEEKVSDNERLVFHRSLATDEFLTGLFSANHYDGIVNFIHYKEAEDYKKVHPLLISNTDQLIFLSSYRVYADEVHPITESAPRLIDVLDDKDFLDNEKYAAPKARCEDFLSSECAGQRWTVVRPVISFSQRRFDLLLYSHTRVLDAAKNGEVLLLPEIARDFKAGWDWAGNSGKLIANLFGREAAIGERFTVYSGHGYTWGDVAELYGRTVGLKVRWCDEEEYLDFNPTLRTNPAMHWAWIYDRRFDRAIDNSKILSVTGLTRGDFASPEYGLKHELEMVGWKG